MTGTNWGDDDMGGDDVTLGDPFLAGVKRDVHTLNLMLAGCAVFVVGLLIIAALAFLLLTGLVGGTAPHSATPSITGGIGSALTTSAP